MVGETDTWQLSAGGAFNKVYINKNRTLVFKVAHHPDYATDTPERSVHLFNLLNPNMKPKAEIATVIIDGEAVRGGTFPYIQSKYEIKKALLKPKLKAKIDIAIAFKLIDIYNQTSRIIVDADVPGNLIVTAKQGVVCVDVGLALDIENEETEYLSKYARAKSIVSEQALDIENEETEGLSKYARSKSIVSAQAWKDMQQDIGSRLNNQNPIYPKTTTMIKALLFIRQHRPDISNVDFLKTTENMELLATSYDASAPGPGIALLDNIKLVTLNSMKESCEKVLLDYIRSRGRLDDSKTFYANFFTRNCRDVELTKKKINVAKSLIEKIKASSSIEEVQDSLEQIRHDSEDNGLLKGRFHGFSASLGLCKIISKIPLTPTPAMQVSQRTSLG